MWITELRCTEEQIHNYALFEIDGLMKRGEKSLADFPGMPIPDCSIFENSHNRLIVEELDYDVDNLKTVHNHLYKGLNNGQRHVYDLILDSINNQSGTPFFVYGHGGIGKTFLWSTIMAKLRSEGKIVLAVDISKIATLLLSGGRTTHSRFQIPLDISEESTCYIKKGTQLAKLLVQTTLIIWDEAPMANKYCFEALNKTLKDILSKKYQSNVDKTFGGLTVALGGDFRQILPVIPKRKKHDIIQAFLSSSSLWKHVTVFTLIENMRLKTNLVNPMKLDNLKAFDKWLLNIREGRDVAEDESYIQIPKDLKIDQHASHEETIMNAIFPDLSA
ncbi:ATP-dependent DNA helicase PIF1-like [Pistacia vera]|uniref:ATP-dependent DNA helicase PIF1-like n=1 Tax=Pistacia vera TaxID=55513 RepID=UPI001263DCA0|nr:ATP-dependent DNA helicase PIF1-like [Pistacia vera]